MKNQELFLASALIALVAGAGAALATRAIVSGDGRESSLRSTERESAAAPVGDGASSPARALDELRMENAALAARLGELESRIAELLSTRTPAAPALGGSSGGRLADDALAAAPSRRELLEVTPAFVDSVQKALDSIHAREELERENRRKELQAERIEQRVTTLQQDLGLTSRQTSDLRTALIAQDDKREELFTGMREGLGDPRDLRDRFRTIREETLASVQTILTPDQYAGFVQREEFDFSRRGPDFPGARPFDGDPARDGPGRPPR